MTRFIARILLACVFGLCVATLAIAAVDEEDLEFGPSEPDLARQDQASFVQSESAEAIEIPVALVVANLNLDVKNCNQFMKDNAYIQTMQGESLNAFSLVAAACLYEKENNIEEKQGERFVIRIFDDHCNEDDAVDIAKEIASQKIQVVIGHFCSGPTIKAAPIYEQHDILQITTSATDPRITDNLYSHLLRLAARSDVQAEYAAGWISNFTNKRVIAILDDGKRYGKTLAESFQQALARSGVEDLTIIQRKHRRPDYKSGDDSCRGDSTEGKRYIAFKSTIKPGQRQFVELIERVKYCRISIIYYGGHVNDFSYFVKQLYQEVGAGNMPVIVAGDSLHSQKLWEIAKEAAEGLMFTNTYDPIHSEPEYEYLRIEQRRAELMSKMEQIFGSSFTVYGIYTYAALEIAHQLRDRLQDLENPRVLKASDLIHDMHRSVSGGWRTDTVMGNVEFDLRGDWKNAIYSVYGWTKRDEKGQYKHIF